MIMELEINLIRNHTRNYNKKILMPLKCQE